MQRYLNYKLKGYYKAQAITYKPSLSRGPQCVGSQTTKGEENTFILRVQEKIAHHHIKPLEKKWEKPIIPHFSSPPDIHTVTQPALGG